MTTLEQSVHRALALHKSGDLVEAEGLYAAALKELPDHPDLLHMYGLLKHQRGEPLRAIDFISRAIKASPKNASFHNNLGEVLRVSGQLERAIEAYRKAIRIDPKYVVAHQHLGNVLLQAGKSSEAVAAYRNALALGPSDVQSLQFLAVAADKLQDNATALEAFERLAALRPKDAETLRNCGILLSRLNRFSDAATMYERALAIEPGLDTSFLLADTLDRLLALQPATAGELGPRMEANYRRILSLNADHVETHVRLGVLLTDGNRLDDALAHLRRAVALSPRDPVILLHLGAALQRAPLIDEAIATYEAALAMDQAIPALHADLAAALAKRGRLDDALAAADRAISLNSAHAPAWNNRATILQDLGCAADAIDAFRTAADLAPENPAIASNYLYAQHYLPHDRAHLFRQHLTWAKTFAPGVADAVASSVSLWTPARPLRLGLISGDFKNHSVTLFIEPLLKNLDRSRIHATCYSNAPLEDAITQRLQSLAAGWRSVTGLSDEQAAQQIRADGIDILIDLSGHTAHNRLNVLARRPAPMQMTWLGYPNTTGLSAIDYRITDAKADLEFAPDDGPIGSQIHTEKLLALPNAWCYQPPASAPDITDLPALARGHVTFACFNNLLKVTPGLVALWGRILGALPKSRLLLKSAALGTLSARARILEQFAAAGISPLRIDLRPVEKDHAAHLAMYNKADIALDTSPYHGTATTCEALWMGLPVVTLAGAVHVSRVGVSLLTSAGLADCIAENPDAYVSIATQIANDLPALSERRKALRTRLAASPLCDGPAFAAAFTTMLERAASLPLSASAR